MNNDPSSWSQGKKTPTASITLMMHDAVAIVPRAFSRVSISGETTSLELKNITDFVKVDNPVSIKPGYNGSCKDGMDNTPAAKANTDLR